MSSPEIGANMQRRDFITLLGGTVATWSAAARAQQTSKVWRLGFFSPASSGQSDNLKAFVQALNDLGYVDGKNIQFERRVADGNLDRLPALAAELVRTNVDVIWPNHRSRSKRRGRRPRQSPL
jgi:putative tryptophan/tyrosine transport system substrate-binding protein